MLNSVKVIIVAAGLGSRLEFLTLDRPKCLLELGEKSILQRQLDIYNKAKISDISIVIGYLKECFTLPNLSYFENDDYKENNILNSLFCAEEKISGDVIISYSDIVFDSGILSELICSPHDISIVVDVDWRDSYIGRQDHPISEAEIVCLGDDFRVSRIGKGCAPISEANGEFIGMMKLSETGAEIFKHHFHVAKKVFKNKPFQRAKTFKQAYLTDLIQEMIDQDVKVHYVLVKGGWKEIDTVEDYKNAITMFTASE